MKFDSAFQITITRLTKSSFIPQDSLLRQWATTVMCNRCEAAALQIGIVDEKRSAEFNQQYRSKTGPTNVLSIPSELPTAVLKRAFPHRPEIFNLIGDLILCPTIIYKEAAQYGKSIESHWAHLTIHGCLHLFGYNHTNTHETFRMESLEQQYLAQFGYPDPY